MENINIPEEYKEYSNVELCSNTLLNVKYFIGINDNPPLLIGKGEDNPVCWLFVQNNGIWSEIISANKPNYHPLQVFAHDKKLLIQLKDIIILDSYEDENSKLIINKLDLKPLGYNIEGDVNGLIVGGNTISGNTISGAKFFIGLG